MIRRLVVLLGALALSIILMTSVAFAGGKSNVFATFAIAEFGQGIWGGGPLFADGTARGHVPISFANGQIIVHFHPTSWSEIDPGVLLEVCFDVHQIKGPSIFPPSLCEELPLTGTPIFEDLDEDGNPDIMLRATIAN